jgi:uroporphyrin-III C-methyltransferase
MSLPLHPSPSGTPGRVLLVGAGPGDPELLTLKAARAIGQATLILVDDLVNPAVLAHAKPDARIVHVGKRGGCKSTPQAFIDRLMCRAAKRGDVVVRLKGGDPFIFGRGGEEMQALKAQGIAVEVINGISSGVAAVSSLGVPLTHREHAHGVLLVTGHAKPGDAGVDWANLAHTAQRQKLTLVIYMGLSSLATIQAGLLQGLAAHTPAALVHGATTAAQQQWATTLGDLAACAQRMGVGSPAIVVVGDVLQAFIGHMQSLPPAEPQGLQIDAKRYNRGLL